MPARVQTYRLKVLDSVLRRHRLHKTPEIALLVRPVQIRKLATIQSVVKIKQRIESIENRRGSNRLADRAAQLLER